MNRIVKTALMAGAAWGALSTVAVAQDVPAQQTSAVEDIIVTARRTEESAQTTPLALTAFSGERLEREGASDTTDLQGAVPNLNIVQGRGSSNATNIYIRGVGQPDALQTFDPAVGVYVDDVYYSRIRGTQFDLLDLARVEVLRGPQGTLYGKNTIGGALKLVSRTPDSGPYLNLAGTFGDYNERSLRISGAQPVSDVLAVGGAFLYSARDGYLTDPVTGADYNDKNTIGARLSAAYTPSDSFRLDVSADYSRDDAGMTVGRALNPLIRADLLAALGFPATVLQPAPPVGSDFNFQSRTTSGLPNSTELEHYGVSATASWTLGDGFTLKSITALRRLDYADYIDIDATQFELGDVLVAVDQDQISQEFQLSYDNGGRLSAVGGAYYLRENVKSYQEAYADDLFAYATLPVGFLRTIGDDLTTESWAAYVNGSWQASDALRVSAGLRYTHESKDYWRTTTQDWSLPFIGVPAVDNLFATFRADPTFAFTVSESWSDVSPMVSIDYRLSSDAMIYARASKGFKSGGFNGRANNPGEQQPYDPETVVSYEIGAKTSWFDRRLTANVAAFYNDYQDFQARVSDCVPDPASPAGPCLIALTVLNAGQLDISGVELELAARPIPALTLDAQIGYLDASYGEFLETRGTVAAPVIIDRSWQTPAFSPEWTARFGGAYEFDLAASGRLTLGGQARYRSEMALSVDNGDLVTKVEYPSMFQDSYWLLDARVVWDSADDRYSLGLYGRNLTDEIYKTDAQEFSSVGNIRTAYYGAPRTWMLKFTARY